MPRARGLWVPMWFFGPTSSISIPLWLPVTCVAIRVTSGSATCTDALPRVEIVAAAARLSSGPSLDYTAHPGQRRRVEQVACCSQLNAGRRLRPAKGLGTMIWTDGKGREWEIDANPDAITVRSADDVLRIDRTSWPQDLQVAPLDRDVVVRFYGPEWEVGFLVSRAQAADLFDRIGVTPVTRAAAPEPPPPSRRPGPSWPRMTGLAVWAVVCGALAFLPLVGLVFGATAILLAWAQRRRARAAAAMAHVRVACNVALALAIGGMGVSVLSLYTFWHVGLAALGSLAERGAGSNWNYSHGAIAATILVVIASLSFHECGHAITAWWCGDAYAKSRGRVTLNPIAHIDLFGTILLPILLAISNMPVFGYAKPVPVRLASVPRYHRAQILVSAAGPGANLLLAAVSLALLLVMGCLLALLVPGAKVVDFANASPGVVIDGVAGGPVLAGIAMILKTSFSINLLLAFFNLIPVPPLDGSWILQYLFPSTLGAIYARIRPFGFLIFIGLLWTGALSILLIPMVIPLLGGLTLVALCTGL